MGSDFPLLFLRQFVFNEDVGLKHTPMCARYRIGSSNVANLLRKGVSMRDAHGDYFSGKNRFLGTTAEHAVAEEYGNMIVIDHPFLISEAFPFICATPDFIAEFADEPPYVVEVKSGATDSETKQNSRSKRTVAQVLTALEVFNLQKGWITPVKRPPKGSTYFTVHQPKTILNNNYLFKNRKMIISRYVEFMKMYFSFIYSIDIDDAMEKEMQDLIESRVPKRRINKKYATLEQLKERIAATKATGDNKCPKPTGDFIPHRL